MILKKVLNFEHCIFGQQIGAVDGVLGFRSSEVPETSEVSDASRFPAIIQKWKL